MIIKSLPMLGIRKPLFADAEAVEHARSRNALRLGVSGLTLVLAACVLFVPGARAADFTIVDGQTETTQQTLGAGETGTINEGGAIDFPGGGNNAILITGAGASVRNEGKIAAGQFGITSNANTDVSSVFNAGNLVGEQAGIWLGAVSNLGSLTNTGLIQGVTDSAIYSYVNLDNLTNSGTITGKNSTVGVGGVLGSVVNTGTITGGSIGIDAGTLTSLSNTNLISGADRGIFALGPLTSLTNSGTISGGTGGAIRTGNIGSLINSKTISGGTDGIRSGIITSLTNTGTISGESGFGIDTANGDILGLINTGIISGGTTGIKTSETQGTITSLTNTGTISGGSAEGIITSVIESLTNSGTISGGTYGLRVRWIRNVVNTGTIISDGVGIGTDNGSGITNLTNSGKIIGLGGIAIREQGAGGNTLLTLNAGSNIQGTIDLGGGVNTLNVGKGLNLAATFVGAAPVIGTIDSAFYKVVGNLVTVVDPASLAAVDAVVADVTGGISGAISSRISARATGVLTALSTSEDESEQVAPEEDKYAGASWWLKGFGGYRNIKGTGLTTGSDHFFGGAVIGVDGQFNQDLQLGLFGGLSTSHLKVRNSVQDVDTEGYFAGFYGQYGNALSFALTGGVLANDSQRYVANNLVVGGIETAAAGYNGYFIAPEVTLGGEIDLGGLVVRPSVRARYTYQRLDGYSETGSAANLTVGGRDMHMLDWRLQLAVPVSAGDDHLLEFRLGVDGRVVSGTDSVETVLLGQANSYDPGGDGVSGSVFVGGDYSYQVTDNASIFASTEVAVGEMVNFSADAQAGLKVSF